MQIAAERPPNGVVVLNSYHAFLGRVTLKAEATEFDHHLVGRQRRHDVRSERRAAQERRPSREEAEGAVRTLVRWAGDDPDREGLVGTPERVVRAYEEFFTGYHDDPVEILQRTFEEVEGYDEMVLLRDIRFESHCEHHMAPILGRAHIAYLPDHRVVGISKLARLVQVYAKRLQIQEKMTAQIANTIQEVLQPLGVAVMIEASHQCMTTRGVYKPGAALATSRMLGAFRENAATRREFLSLIRSDVSFEN